MNDERNDLLTTKQTLALLGISRSTLYTLIDRGLLKPVPTLPSLKKPRRRYRRADVERLLPPLDDGTREHRS